jgi:hypothetical protein
MASSPVLFSPAYHTCSALSDLLQQQTPIQIDHDLKDRSLFLAPLKRGLGSPARPVPSLSPPPLLSPPLGFLGFLVIPWGRDSKL